MGEGCVDVRTSWQKSPPAKSKGKLGRHNHISFLQRASFPNGETAKSQ